MSDPAKAPRPSRRPSGLWPYAALVILGTLPLFGLGAYAYAVANGAARRLIEAGNLASATITAELVRGEFQHWVQTLESFARLPALHAAVRDADEEGLRGQLQVLVESHPRVDRAFVTDPAALLWSDYPEAPESLGRRFDERDWYEGVSRSWQPYVSGVYRRHAEPRPLLVAIAVPVRAAAASDEVHGVLVLQVRLEGLTQLLREVVVGESGLVLLVDHTGTVAAHPRLDLQSGEHRSYVDTAPLAAAREGRRECVEYLDPPTGTPMLATAVPCKVQSHSWTVVAQQPRDIALRSIRRLGWQIAGAGMMLSLLVGGLCFGLCKFHDRTKQLNRRLEALNAELSRENAERVRAEQALQESNQGLERRVEERTRQLREKNEQFRHAQKMEAVGRLAGGVAHDFNNMLSVILGYSDLALRDAPPGSRLREQIELVREAGEQAESLTRQLLAFSRKQVLQPRILDLNEVVARIDKMLRHVIGEDIELATHLAPGLAPVQFDPGQIEQIIMNLAVNARDAMPKGGKLTIETANVELSAEYAREHPGALAGPHVALVITDTGIGMNAETKARIFEPFFTTKPRGRGTGLGLSTVFGIVKQSGGNIWVYSEPGRGTTFKVYLPSAEGEVAAAAPTPKGRDADGTETILLVEDEARVRALAAGVLRKAGYTVLEAGAAGDAVEVFRRHQGPVHLLLTDVVLPGIGGPGLAAMLRQRRPGLAVLFMSGYTDDAIAHQGLLDAGSPFLDKPIRPQLLLERVREALGGDPQAGTGTAAGR